MSSYIVANSHSQRGCAYAELILNKFSNGTLAVFKGSKWRDKTAIFDADGAKNGCDGTQSLKENIFTILIFVFLFC